ncbi:MAG: isoprenyl transferase [Verrucomicrobia bacterium]|nr:isoprenyl transferase [Verrucomicrobiota bacterium]
MTTPSSNPPGSVPRHIAIIMDGNGRWARSKGLERLSGHERGAEAVRDCVKGCRELGVEYLTLYAFSTENWQRPKSEVMGLMALLERFVTKELAELNAQGVRVEAIGHITDLPESTQKALRHAIETTAQNNKLTLVLALSYSSRVEIVDAIQEIAREVQAGKLDPSAIDAELLSRHLYTRAYPDPDLLIRTSGEMRLSNFLLWQLSYTEFYITPTLWPDFRKEELLQAVRDFGKRQRRFGGI